MLCMYVWTVNVIPTYWWMLVSSRTKGGVDPGSVNVTSDAFGSLRSETDDSVIAVLLDVV